MKISFKEACTCLMTGFDWTYNVTSLMKTLGIHEGVFSLWRCLNAVCRMFLNRAQFCVWTVIMSRLFLDRLKQADTLNRATHRLGDDSLFAFVLYSCSHGYNGSSLETRMDRRGRNILEEIKEKSFCVGTCYELDVGAKCPQFSHNLQLLMFSTMIISKDKTSVLQSLT